MEFIKDKMKQNINQKINISESVLNNWQNIIDTIAKLLDIPSTLIMTLVDNNIEVFISSQTEGNPYKKGDSEHFLDSGLYCEKVINTQEKLLIPNALNDEDWKDNPDIKLNMISYLGFPISFPNKQPFGTICVLDTKENAYSKTYENLIENFRDMIQSHLELIYMNSVLGEENKTISDYLNEIKALRQVIPICSSCKKVRAKNGEWNDLEVHISKYSEAELTHTYCSTCSAKEFGVIL